MTLSLTTGEKSPPALQAEDRSPGSRGCHNVGESEVRMLQMLCVCGTQALLLSGRPLVCILVYIHKGRQALSVIVDVA